MANLSKLDETIDQLEVQAEILKHNNKVLAKVSELNSLIEKGLSEISTGNKNFNEVKKNIQDTLNSFIESINNLEQKNDKNIETLVTSNKKFLREFEDTISSRLERFSSDIQISTRQEISHLQEVLQNNIASHFSNLESKQKDLFSIQSRQIKFLKILLWIIIFLSIGLGIKLFL